MGNSKVAVGNRFIFLSSIWCTKAGYTWIEIWLVQKEQTELRSMNGDSGCTEVDLPT